MSGITAEMEGQLEQELTNEGAPGLEQEYELQFETEPEHQGVREQEQQAFFNHLSAMADRGGRSQALRRIALAAAREALRAHRATLPVIEGEGEFEDESGISFEVESHLHPAARNESMAFMEHLGYQAAAADTEQEAAEQFLPLIPLAAKAVLPVAARVLPAVARRVAPILIRRVAPQLTSGVARIARTLFRSPTTRPLLRTIPSIARRTLASLVQRQAGGGGPVTPQMALNALARNAVRVLGNPRTATNAFRRSRALDSRYHRVARKLVGAPAYPATPTRQRSGAVYGGSVQPVVGPGLPRPRTWGSAVPVIPCPWHWPAGQTR